MALTDKQQRFVEEYLVDLNATQAAIRAGYSQRTAAEQGCQLLGKKHVAEAIAAARQALSEKVGLKAERVVEEIRRIAFANITDVMSWGEAVAVKDAETGEVTVAQGIALVPSYELPEHAQGAIAEVRQTREGLALKMHSKVEALDKLARHLGVYAAEKHELTGRNGGPIEVKEMSALERAKALAAILARAQAEAQNKSAA